MKHALDVVYCCFFFTHSWISHELSNFQRFLILFGFFSLKAIFFLLTVNKSYGFDSDKKNLLFGFFSTFLE